MKRMNSILAFLGPLAVLGIVAAGPVTVVLTGCKAIESTFDAIGDATAGTAVGDISHGVARAAESGKDYSPSEQHYIGRAVAAEILTRFKVHDDARLAEYVNLVGQTVVLSNPDALQTFTGYHFTILEGDEVNAISAPGGFVFLTVGTVKLAKNEDELASVLAHEVAHVTLGHGIDAIKAATRKQSIALLTRGIGRAGAEAAGTQGGDAKALAELTANFADAIQDITGELLVKGYSRKQELAADKTASDFLKNTGYSRPALTSYLGRLGAAGGTGGWGSTHPSARDRIEAIQPLVAGDPATVLAGVPVREKRFKANT